MTQYILTFSDDTCFEEYNQYKKEISALKRKQELVKKYMINSYFKEHTEILLPSGILIASYKPIAKIFFEEKSFKNDHPDLHEKYLNIREEKRIHVS